MAEGRDRAQPTWDWVHAQLELRRGRLSNTHKRFRTVDEWLHADDDPSPVLKYVSHGFPAGHQWEIYPYAWKVLTNGVQQYMTAKVPQVTVGLDADFKAAHKDAADDEKAMQQAIQGVFHKIATESAVNPFLDLCYQQIGPGLGVLSYPPNYEQDEEPDHGRGTPEEEEAWAAYEQRRANRSPWTVTSMHPTWVFPDLDHGTKPRDWIIERKVSLSWVADQFRKLGLDPSTESSEPTATYVEYVSPDWYGCWVNGEPVTPHPNAAADGIAPNGLRHVWMEPAFSGMGKLDEAASWEHLCTGLIHRGIGLFKGLTRDDNRMALIRDTYTPKFVWSSETTEDAMAASADFDPLSPAVLAKANTDTVEPMVAPVVPDAIIKDINERKQRMEQMYGPGTLSGEPRSEAAAKYAARLEQARGPYGSPKENAEQACANMAYNMFWDIKYEPQMADFSVSWQDKAAKKRYFAKLKPEQIHLAHCKISVDFSPMGAEEKAFKVEDAIQKEQAGWWPREKAMKEGGEIDDTAEAMAQIDADLVTKSPEYIAFLTNLHITVMTGKLIEAGIMPAPPMDPMMMDPNAPPPGGGMGMQPQAPLPPGVAQQPGPGLATPQEATQRAQSAFQPPRVAAGSRGGY